MRPKKILIVDDEAAVRSLLREAVASTGFSTFAADCGAAALDVAAREAPFDLVITDILMPGMDGVELAQQLWASGSATSFLFISGFCDADQISARIHGLPYAAFMNKPF